MSKTSLVKGFLFFLETPLKCNLIQSPLRTNTTYENRCDEGDCSAKTMPSQISGDCEGELEHPKTDEADTIPD